MNVDFLIPVRDEILEDVGSKLTIGNSIQVYSNTQGFPTLDEVKLVILGVKEGRSAINNENSGCSFDNFRRKFYQLFPGKWDVKIADIGDVEKGNTIKDTYFAVSEIVSSLIKQDIIPIIIGGGQDITYANYRAYDALEQVVNLVSIDSRFDIGNVDAELNSRSFLSKIITEIPNNLFNYSNIGYQTYYNSQEDIELIDKLYFDAYRVGELKNIEFAEPVLRDADVVSLDLSSVRCSDAMANNNATVNGFYGDEICGIARYAGISDKVSSFGVYEYDESLDVNGQTADLISQIIWCFIEGVDNRTQDYPFCNKDSYEKYTIVFEHDEPINFYKSDKSGRWWMEINLISDNKYKRHTLIPCTYNDYLNALEHKVPEKWYKALRKLT